MKIGVLGTGVVGQTIASKLIHLGHDVMMGSRDEANPNAVAWANKENVKKNDTTYKRALFGTFANAAEFGELVINCTLGTATLEALDQTGAENLKGKILIDTTNPLDYTPGFWTLTVSNTDSLGEQIQRAFPETKVVKTLNTVNANVMVDPAKLQEQTTIFVSGNDVTAKTFVTRILREWFGWHHILDLGDITTSRAVEMYVVLWRCVRLATNSQRFNIKVVGV